VDQARRARDHEPHLPLRRGHGLWEEGKRSPISKANSVRSATDERRIRHSKKLRGSALLDDPNKLIIETCIATGARIPSLGLQWRHVNLDAGTIKIEQRVWHQDVGRPKSDGTGAFGIGDLAGRFRAKPRRQGHAEFVRLPAETGVRQPLWDRACATHSIRQRRLRCDFPDWGRTPSGEQTSLGGNKSAQCHRSLQDCRPQRSGNDGRLHLRHAERQND